MSNKDYLGDAVYVELDEIGRMKLTTSDGIRDTNVIYFEPVVIEAMIRWITRVFGKDAMRRLVE